MFRLCQRPLVSVRSGIASRSYITSMTYTRPEVNERITKLRDSIQGNNWADHLNTVTNVPFWEVELEKISTAAAPFLADPDMGKKMEEIYHTMDCLYACEDVRDHLNELMEISTRSSGIMGIGIFAGEKLENMEEQIESIVTEYEVCKQMPQITCLFSSQLKNL
eukprot:GEMP01110552.1.p1 GENE.GEMP01110552.1~~GEMP01110552.1.p1  ORF type:complete len:179 (+),score=28.76 GEMP01110552.1:46-537(+)